MADGATVAGAEVDDWVGVFELHAERISVTAVMIKRIGLPWFFFIVKPLFLSLGQAIPALFLQQFNQPALARHCFEIKHVKCQIATLHTFFDCGCEKDWMGTLEVSDFFELHTTYHEII